MLKQIEKYAKENNIPIIEKDTVKFIVDFIDKNKPKRILEIGTAIGYSAITMALANEKSKIITLEKDKDKYLEAVNNIKIMKLNRQIDVYHVDALKYMTLKKFDLIFIDGPKAQNQKLFERFKRNLNKGGYIITDNINFHGLTEQKERIESKNLRNLVDKIRRYKDFLMNNPEFDTTFFKIGDGLSLSWRKK